MDNIAYIILGGAGGQTPSGDWYPGSGPHPEISENWKKGLVVLILGNMDRAHSKLC